MLQARILAEREIAARRAVVDDEIEDEEMSFGDQGYQRDETDSPH